MAKQARSQSGLVRRGRNSGNRRSKRKKFEESTSHRTNEQTRLDLQHQLREKTEFQDTRRNKADRETKSTVYSLV